MGDDLIVSYELNLVNGDIALDVHCKPYMSIRQKERKLFALVEKKAVIIFRKHLVNFKSSNNKLLQYEFEVTKEGILINMKIGLVFSEYLANSNTYFAFERDLKTIEDINRKLSMCFMGQVLSLIKK